MLLPGIVASTSGSSGSVARIIPVNANNAFVVLPHVSGAATFAMGQNQGGSTGGTTGDVGTPWQGWRPMGNYLSIQAPALITANSPWSTFDNSLGAQEMAWYNNDTTNDSWMGFYHGGTTVTGSSNLPDFTVAHNLSLPYTFEQNVTCHNRPSAVPQKTLTFTYTLTFNADGSITERMVGNCTSAGSNTFNPYYITKQLCSGYWDSYSLNNGSSFIQVGANQQIWPLASIDSNFSPVNAPNWQVKNRAAGLLYISTSNQDGYANYTAGGVSRQSLQTQVYPACVATGGSPVAAFDVTRTFSIGFTAPDQVWPFNYVAATQGFDMVTEYAPATPVPVSVTGFTWAATGGGQITFTTGSAHGITVGMWFKTNAFTASGANFEGQAIAGTTGSTLIAALTPNPGSTSTGLVYPETTTVQITGGNMVWTGNGSTVITRGWNMAGGTPSNFYILTNTLSVSDASFPGVYLSTQQGSSIGPSHATFAGGFPAGSGKGFLESGRLVFQWPVGSHDLQLLVTNTTPLGNAATQVLTSMIASDLTFTGAAVLDYDASRDGVGPWVTETGEAPTIVTGKIVFAPTSTVGKYHIHITGLTQLQRYVILVGGVPPYPWASNQFFYVDEGTNESTSSYIQRALLTSAGSSVTNQCYEFICPSGFTDVTVYVNPAQNTTLTLGTIVIRPT